MIDDYVSVATTTPATSLLITMKTFLYTRTLVTISETFCDIKSIAISIVVLPCSNSILLLCYNSSRRYSLFKRLYLQNANFQFYDCYSYFKRNITLVWWLTMERIAEMPKGSRQHWTFDSAPIVGWSLVLKVTQQKAERTTLCGVHTLVQERKTLTCSSHSLSWFADLYLSSQFRSKDSSSETFCIQWKTSRLQR